MTTKKVLKLVKKATNMTRKNFGSMRDLIKLKSAYETLRLKQNIKKKQQALMRDNIAQVAASLDEVENKLVCDEASQIKFTQGCN